MNKILICILISIAIIFTFSPMVLANDTKAIHTVGWVSDDKTWEIPASPLTLVPGTELKFTLKEPCVVHIQWNAEVETGFIWDGKPFDNGYSRPGKAWFHMRLNKEEISYTNTASYLLTTTSVAMQDMRVLPAGEYTITVHAMETGAPNSHIGHKYLTMTAYKLSQIDEEFKVPERPLFPHPNSKELIKNK